MHVSSKATRIELFNFSTPPMRAFHMTWFAFFLCFFAWFAIAPLMTVVAQEMSLTREQIGWCIIGSVAATIVARLFVGWLCEQIGPRLAYTGLLILGSLPIMAIGLADRYETFLLLRIATGRRFHSTDHADAIWRAHRRSLSAIHFAAIAARPGPGPLDRLAGLDVYRGRSLCSVGSGILPTDARYTRRELS
jgi:MFS family permease